MNRDGYHPLNGNRFGLFDSLLPSQRCTGVCGHTSPNILRRFALGPWQGPELLAGGRPKGGPRNSAPHRSRPRRGRQQSPVLQGVLSPLRGSEITTQPTGGLPSVDPRLNAHGPFRAKEPPDAACAPLNSPFCLVQILLHLWDGNGPPPSRFTSIYSGRGEPPSCGPRRFRSSSLVSPSSANPRRFAGWLHPCTVTASTG